MSLVHGRDDMSGFRDTLHGIQADSYCPTQDLYPHYFHPLHLVYFHRLGLHCHPHESPGVHHQCMLDPGEVLGLCLGTQIFLIIHMGMLYRISAQKILEVSLGDSSFLDYFNSIKVLIA